jgi:carbonic anhydrase/acetyltransferase-like protein (isoleucine patch superfamily)
MGGFGPELRQLLRQSYASEEYRYAGYFDDSPPRNHDHSEQYQGPISAAADLPTGMALLMGTFLPEIKQAILNTLSPNIDRFEFPNIIHRSVLWEADELKMGYGNVIQGGCWFTTDIAMGNFNSFNHGVTVGHGVRIGSLNAFMPQVALAGDVEVGEANLLALHSSILQAKKLGNRQHLGPHACLMSHANLSAPGTLWMGVPALPHTR